MILAFSAQPGFDSLGVLKVLAVVGGAGLGGLLVGLFSQLLARTLTMQKLPPKLLHGSRLGGAGVAGWLVALWVFGGGGSGLGGGGGFGVGPGEGTGTDGSPPVASKEGDRDKNEPSTVDAKGGESLRVEVLGKSTLTRIAKEGKPDLERCYRVEGDEGARLLTLKQVKDLVRNRQKQTPPLRRLEIVLYNDSPARDVPLVSQLSQWAREQDGADNEKMRVDFSSPDTNAPTQ